MRGSGKSLMGRALSHHLHWAFIDTDAEFARAKSVAIADFVATHGWPAFRREEAALFASLLVSHPNCTVLATGGGLVETEDGRAALRAHRGLVVQLTRPIGTHCVRTNTRHRYDCCILCVLCGVYCVRVVSECVSVAAIECARVRERVAAPHCT